MDASTVFDGRPTSMLHPFPMCVPPIVRTLHCMMRMPPTPGWTGETARLDELLTMTLMMMFIHVLYINCLAKRI